MPNLDFPTSPTNGQVYEGYIYNSTDNVWNRLPTAPNISINDFNDTSITTPQIGDSLVYDGSNWVNGPRSGNAIINGDFDIWQRGTSFNLTPTDYFYTADRWRALAWTGSTATVSRQSFSPGELIIPGYGSPRYFLRYYTSDTSVGHILQQFIENVETFAGEEVTISFWAKAASPTTLGSSIIQNFGSGGSGQSGVNFVMNDTSLTTSWKKFTGVGTVLPINGKIIGANSYIYPQIIVPNGNNTLDVWGVQLEAGPVATPFQLAGGGSKAAELALCQRYYEVVQIQGNTYHGQYAGGVNRFYGQWVPFKTYKRVSPVLSYQYVSANEYWTIVGTSAVSLSTSANIAFAWSLDGVQMNQTRSTGGATPVSGNVYVFEAAFNIIANAEL